MTENHKWLRINPLGGVCTTLTRASPQLRKINAAMITHFARR